MTKVQRLERTIIKNAVKLNTKELFRVDRIITQENLQDACEELVKARRRKVKRAR